MASCREDASQFCRVVGHDPVGAKFQQVRHCLRCVDRPVLHGLTARMCSIDHRRHGEVQACRAQGYLQRTYLPGVIPDRIETQTRGQQPEAEFVSRACRPLAFPPSPGAPPPPLCVYF